MGYAWTRIKRKRGLGNRKRKEIKKKEVTRNELKGEGGYLWLIRKEIHGFGVMVKGIKINYLILYFENPPKKLYK